MVSVESGADIYVYAQEIRRCAYKHPSINRQYAEIICSRSPHGVSLGEVQVRIREPNPVGQGSGRPRLAFECAPLNYEGPVAG